MFVGSNRVSLAPDVIPEVHKPRKLVAQEDGKFVYVDEENPFEGLDGNAFKLKSQLRDGNKLRDCGVRKLERTSLADKAAAVGSIVMNDVNALKAEQAAKAQEQVSNPENE